MPLLIRKLSKSCTKCNSGESSGSSGSSSNFRVKNIKSYGKFETASVYDADTSSVLWVDFGVKRASKTCLYRYDTNSKKIYSAAINNNGKNLPAPSYIVPVKTSSKALSEVLVGLGVYSYLIGWDGKSKSASIIRKVTIGSESETGPLETLG